MTVFAKIAAEIVAVVLVLGLVQSVLLAFRNPHRHARLRGSGMEAIVATALVGIVTFTLGALIQGLVVAGADPFAALFETMVVAVVAWFGLWRLFRVGPRLKRADAGGSPFEPLRDDAGERAAGPAR